MTHLPGMSLGTGMAGACAPLMEEEALMGVWAPTANPPSGTLAFARVGVGAHGGSSDDGGGRMAGSVAAAAPGCGVHGAWACGAAMWGGGSCAAPVPPPPACPASARAVSRVRSISCGAVGKGP